MREYKRQTEEESLRRENNFAEVLKILKAKAEKGDELSMIVLGDLFVLGVLGVFTVLCLKTPVYEAPKEKKNFFLPFAVS